MATIHAAIFMNAQSEAKTVENAKWVWITLDGLTIHLPEGTTLAQAQAIADAINATVKS